MSIVKLSETLLQTQNVQKNLDILSVFELRIIAWILLGMRDKASIELDYVFDAGLLLQHIMEQEEQFEKFPFFLAKTYCELPAWNGDFLMALDRLHNLRHWLISVRCIL